MGSCSASAFSSHTRSAQQRSDHHPVVPAVAEVVVVPERHRSAGQIEPGDASFAIGARPHAQLAVRQRRQVRQQVLQPRVLASFHAQAIRRSVAEATVAVVLHAHHKPHVRLVLRRIVQIEDV